MANLSDLSPIAKAIIERRGGIAYIRDNEIWVDLPGREPWQLTDSTGPVRGEPPTEEEKVRFMNELISEAQMHPFEDISEALSVLREALKDGRLQLIDYERQPDGQFMERSWCFPGPNVELFDGPGGKPTTLQVRLGPKEN